MTLNYIFGGSGTGKTTLCLSQIADELKNNSGDNTTLIYVVPEQFSMASEKNIVMLSEGKATIRAQVLSFERLAYHVYRKSGGVCLTLLDDVGKNMLIRKIVSELQGELAFFHKSIDKQGFIDNVALAITEFYRYNVTTDDLEAVCKNLSANKADTGFYLKLSDLKLIYNRYKEFVSSKYISSDSALSFLPEKIKQADILKGAKVWINGFNGFTPQEYNVIRHILGVASSVTVALTVKSSLKKHADLKITDPFFETKLTVNRITDIALDQGVKVEKPLYLKQTFRFNASPELKFLEENYFSYKKEKFLDDVSHGDIEVLKCLSKQDEVTNAANKIISLVRENRYKYNDIAIVVSSISDFDSNIKTIFTSYNIPFFIDKKTDVLTHPLVELIRSAVDIAAYNRSYEAVFRFLKTEMTSMSREQVDLLENYAIAFGISGYKWGLERFKYGFTDGLYDEGEIHSLRDMLISDLRPIMELTGKKRTVVEFSAAIFAMLERLNVTETLERRINEMSKLHNNYEIMQYSQIWGKVCAVFDKLVEILGDEKVTLRELSKILEAGFKATDMGLYPPSQDQVIVGDIDRTRLPNIKALLVLGANDGVMPKIYDDDGLLTDDERATLNSFKIELAPDCKRRSQAEQFLLYKAFTKPKYKLVISYSTGTLDGKTLRHSMVVARLKAMFPKLEEKQADNIGKGVTLPKPMFKEIGEAIRQLNKGLEIEDEQKLALKWFADSKAYSEKVLKMEKLLNERKKELKLRTETVRSLYGREIYTSTTRLQKYVECPFAYFVQYNLKAKERKTYEVRTVDLGNLFHDVLDVFLKEASERGISWRELTHNTISSLVDECIEKVAPSIANEVMLSTEQYKYTAKRMRRIAKKSIWALTEHIKRGDFEPFASEIQFADSSPIKSITIGINGSSFFKITGRIDRVDITTLDGNTYVKIIDYKTGATKFDPTDIYFGSQLQLFLYLDALIKNGKALFGDKNIEAKLFPGGVFYFNINDPIIELDVDFGNEASKNSIEQIALEKFKMSGLVLAEKEIVDKMDKGLSGHSAIIPVNVLKDGGFGKNASVATLEQFDKICSFVVSKISEIGKDIVEGKIDIRPFKKGTNTACMYCSFGVVCGIEAVDGNDKYNYVRKISSIREIDSTPKK